MDDWSEVADWSGVAARGAAERVGSAETESGEAVLFASGWTLAGLWLGVTD